MTRMTPLGAALLIVAAASACGGGDGAPTGGSTPTMAKASPSGDAQTGAPGAQLPDPLRVRITQGGNPVSGRTVNWSITSTGGQVNPATTQTGADGIASTVATLPASAGTMTVQAAASGVTGSPVSFGLTAAAIGLQANVQVVNNDFTPSSVSVRAGGTVTFTWGTGSVLHTVTPVAPATIPISPGHPALLSAPNEFVTTFPTQGTFTYFCTNHGTAQSGMRGTVTVVP